MNQDASMRRQLWFGKVIEGRIASSKQDHTVFDQTLCDQTIFNNEYLRSSCIPAWVNDELSSDPTAERPSVSQVTADFKEALARYNVPKDSVSQHFNAVKEVITACEEGSQLLEQSLYSEVAPKNGLSPGALQSFANRTFSPDDLQTKDPKLDSFYNQVNLHRSVICKEIEMAEAWKGKYGKFGTREKLIERFQFACDNDLYKYLADNSDMSDAASGIPERTNKTSTQTQTKRRRRGRKHRQNGPSTNG